MFEKYIGLINKLVDSMAHLLKKIHILDPLILLFHPAKVLSIGKAFYWESLAGSVIQANWTVEFEDCLRTGVPPGSHT